MKHLLHIKLMSQTIPPWLLFFYTVPAKPGNLRMKVWRRLLKMGAISLKGSVYLLPATDDHLEALHWLAAEVAGLGGEAAFVKTERIETMGREEIIALFNAQRESDYASLEASLETKEVELGSLEQQLDVKGWEGLQGPFRKLLKEHRAIRAIDFFHAASGTALQKRLELFEERLNRLTKQPRPTQAEPAGPRRKEEYRDRVWMTRKNPFVDRMASAWLIRRFIDPGARFEFLEEGRMPAETPGAVSFDVPGGDFSHHRDRCTFEVLAEAFGLRGKVLRKMAEVVHELDLKDGKFANPQASGVETILLGIRKTAKDDAAALEEGIAVFARLYAALSK
jgi:hypothetical protein